MAIFQSCLPTQLYLLSLRLCPCPLSQHQHTFRLVVNQEAVLRRFQLQTERLLHCGVSKYGN
jgi:hypothetical protein